MIVTLLLLAALVLFLLGAFGRAAVGRAQTIPLGLACVTLAMLWPQIAS